mmetsp:Transcript_13330/g.36168  ORF Transcript_13330/g.36168 Transcript_13330/m.36168 type:complete len:284 (+) Transcript_13330:303-1154(+)
MSRQMDGFILGATCASSGPPLLNRRLEIVVKGLLHVGFDVPPVGIGYANEDHAPGLVVRKINALRRLAPEDAEQHRTPALVYCCLVLIHGHVKILARLLWLYHDLLQRTQLVPYTCGLPARLQLVHRPIAAHKHEHPIWDDLHQLYQPLANLILSSAFVQAPHRQAHGLIIGAPRQRSRPHLPLHINHVWPLQGGSKVCSQFLCKGAQGGQRATGEDGAVRCAARIQKRACRVHAQDGQLHRLLTRSPCIPAPPCAPCAPSVLSLRVRRLADNHAIAHAALFR